MADPRKSVSRRGTSPRVRSYQYDSSIVFSDQQPGGSVSVGLAVKLVSPGVVALTTDASNVRGQLLTVEDDTFCSVQDGGVVELPAGTAAAVTAGKAIVGAALGGAPGYIREVAPAVAAEVGVATGTILNGSDATKVEVDLG